MSSVSNFLLKAYNFEFKYLNILECGACYEGGETKILRNENNCYYIEANPGDFNNLLYTQKLIENETAFNYALTDIDNNLIEFNISSHGGNSSIEHSIEHKNELINIYNANFEIIKVKSITYKNFINNKIQKNIDILVLDIEGHECVVLNTFYNLDITELPKIIVIEAGYDWLNRKKILLDLGYIIDFYEFNNCYLTHKNFKIEKNINIINEINNNNREFIWNNIFIYKNELVF